MNEETKKTFEVWIPVRCHKCNAVEVINKMDADNGWTHSHNWKHWYCPKCSR